MSDIIGGLVGAWPLEECPFARTGRVLLVTAHPDDETIFFSPTLNALQRAGTRVSILCLSTGNADGLGMMRRREIQAAGKALKVADVYVRDSPCLQDGKTNRWEPEVVSSFVRDHCRKFPVNAVSY